MQPSPPRLTRTSKAGQGSWIPVLSQKIHSQASVANFICASNSVKIEEKVRPAVCPLSHTLYNAFVFAPPAWRESERKAPSTGLRASLQPGLQGAWRCWWGVLIAMLQCHRAATPGLAGGRQGLQRLQRGPARDVPENAASRNR